LTTTHRAVEIDGVGEVGDGLSTEEDRVVGKQISAGRGREGFQQEAAVAGKKEIRMADLMSAMGSLGGRKPEPDASGQP
jgi:hypothetical protein